MPTVEELLRQYAHTPEEYPVFARQTHRVLKDGGIVSEQIELNENLIHYVQETALLISVIDGTADRDGFVPGRPFDHVVYLDKSARPVSWLVNLFWDSFAAPEWDGRPGKRPPHSYVNIDRSPWFRKVGLDVSDDGRQKAGGELATYRDFLDRISNVTPRHLAELRALYVPGGIETEDEERILASPSELDGKRVLIVDEVSRTGATLDIASTLFRLAFPKAEEIVGAYFWHPKEPPLKVGNENVMTNLPVWYDPDTLFGRGIGGVSDVYYRSRYERYQGLQPELPAVDLPKLRAQAFAAPVFSAPLLKEDGSVLDLKEEKLTRALGRDMLRLFRDYKAGRLLFVPPYAWIDAGRFEAEILRQGLKLIPEDASDAEADRIRRDPLYFLNFVQKLTGRP